MMLLALLGTALLSFGLILSSWAFRSPSTPQNLKQINRHHFLVLAFPKKAGVVIRPQSGNAATGVLQRAILLSLEELDQNQDELTLFVGDDTYLVASSDITFHPPADSAVLVDALNREIQKWGKNTAWRSVKFATKQQANGQYSYSLLVTDRRGRPVEFVYRVTANIIRPLDMKARSLIGF